MIYLDHAATTPVPKAVADAMYTVLTEQYANPNAQYPFGQEMRRSVEDWRAMIAKAVGCEANQLFFTSCGTEGDNWAIRAACWQNRHVGRHIVTTAVEHHAVLNCCQQLEQEGWEVTRLLPDQNGDISAEAVLAAVRPDTALVSMMLVNNETGCVFPVRETAALLREKNPNAAILTTPWDQLDGMTILSAIEKVSLADELLAHMRAEHEADEAEHEHEHHHHHHDEDEHDHDHCCHHHDHDDDGDDDDDHDHEHCCHHHHDEDEHDHDHHHHHHDGEECDDPHCGCHHHHHHADEVFTSWGTETVKAYSEAELEHILTALDSGEYGAILRAKGIVAAADGGQWLHYDFVPEEHQVRRGPADYTGRICVIGSQLKEDNLSQLFGL